MRTASLLLLSVGLALPLLLLVTSSHAQPPQEDCRYKCDSTNFQTVCGKRLGGRCRSFQNECYRLSYNCQHSCKYDLLFEGACDSECNRIELTTAANHVVNH